MADLAADAGISGDESLHEAAQKLFVYLWREAWTNAPGTLAGDADALHDMRVAVRRLRSALLNIAGEKSVPLVTPRLWRKMDEGRRELAKLGDALGAVRDCDVLNDYLEDYAKRILRMEINDDGGLGKFRRHLHKRRAKAFATMTRKINKASRPGKFKESFARFALGLPAASGPNPPLTTALNAILPQRKAEVLSLASKLADAHDEIGHHELRKSLKKLRYVLEFFEPCYDFPVKPALKRMTNIQDRLGEMQDRVVLRDNIAEVFGKGNLPDDMVAFLHDDAVRQSRLIAKVRKQWAKLDEEFLSR